MMTPSRTLRFLGLFTLAYLLLRYTNLFRELAFEEGTYITPGRQFFEGKGFIGYLGELDLRFNPFHKPPLATLLAGLFSFFGFDWVLGARLAPFLVGFLVCILPFWLTGTTLACWVALMSPFLYAASAHIQTDPIAGLLGMSLLVAGVYRYLEEPQRRRNAVFWFYFGLIVLWCGKLELALIATASLGISGLIFKKLRIRDFWKVFVSGTVLALGISLLFSWILGLTAGLSFMSSAGLTWTVMGGITQAVGEAQTNVHAWVARHHVFSQFRGVRGPTFFALCWVPVLIALVWPRHWGRFFKSDEIHKRITTFGTLLMLSVLPGLVYWMGGWQGDGFPRYFLVVFPPAIVALGLFIRFIEHKYKIYFTALIILISGVTMIPSTWKLYRHPWGITGMSFLSGYRGAALIVQAFTRPDDLVLGYEPSSPYLRNRRWIMESSFVPYPELHEKALKYAPLLNAAIVPGLPEDPHERYKSIYGKMIEPMEKKGAISIRYRSFEIFVFPDKNRSSGGWE